MLRAGVRVCRGLRWGVVGVAALLAFTATSNDADARGRLQRLRAAFASYQPSFASIVVDGNSGKVLQATNADQPRHPASLTKIMTLYLLFERLENGKIKLTTEMPVSAHAAERFGHDHRHIVGRLGGDEANFAKLMTAKARALGMKG